MTTFDFSDSFTSLLKLFTCTTCNNLYEDPVKIGKCNHVFCSKCVVNLENCPICDSSIVHHLLQQKESTKLIVDKIKNIRRFFETSEAKYMITNLPLNILDKIKQLERIEDKSENQSDKPSDLQEAEKILDISNLNKENSFFCYDIDMSEVKIISTQIRRNPKGETPLHVACSKNSSSKLGELVKSGVDVNIKDFANWTALHDAVHNNAYDCAQILLNAGAVVNAPGENYITPLYQAVDLHLPEMCSLLLSYGAEVNCEDYTGKKLFFFETLQFDRWPLDLKDAYLKAFPDANVILVDWTYYSFRYLLFASCNAPAIGSEIGKFFVDLEKNNLIGFNNTHVIGFSLGSQVSGFIGQEIKNETGKLLAKITGLDGVGVGYEGKPKDERLSDDDAEDVVFVHFSALIGYKKPAGRIDFYVNGGTIQTSCIFDFFKPTLSLAENIKKLVCSHYKTPHFQIQSVLGKKFVGYQCPSLKIDSCLDNETVIYGEEIDPKYKGIFYVKTEMNLATTSAIGDILENPLDILMNKKKYFINPVTNVLYKGDNKIILKQLTCLGLKVHKKFQKKDNNIDLFIVGNNEEITYNTDVLMSIINSVMVIYEKDLETFVSVGHPLQIKLIPEEIRTTLTKSIYNNLLRNPRLFDGMNFFIIGRDKFILMDRVKIMKEDLAKLLTMAGGKILARAPAERTVDNQFFYPFHLRNCEKLRKCCNYIIYNEKDRPGLLYNLPELKHVTAQWIIKCIWNFNIDF